MAHGEIDVRLVEIGDGKVRRNPHLGLRVQLTGISPAAGASHLAANEGAEEIISRSRRAGARM